MEKDNIHSIRNCKSRMDFVGSAVLLLIPIITLEIIGVLKTTISFFVLGNIIIWGIYLFLLWALIRECTSGIVNQNGVEITFYNFKEWTETFSWEEYEEIKIENTQWGQHGAHVFIMTFCKRKKSIHDFIFSGNMTVLCTEENYALVKSWIPDSVMMPKVKF